MKYYRMKRIKPLKSSVLDNISEIIRDMLNRD